MNTVARGICSFQSLVQGHEGGRRVVPLLHGCEDVNVDVVAYLVTVVERSDDGEDRDAGMHRILGDGAQSFVHPVQVAARRSGHDVQQHHPRHGLARPGADVLGVMRRVATGEIAQVVQIGEKLLDDASGFLGFVLVQSGHPGSM